MESFSGNNSFCEINFLNKKMTSFWIRGFVLVFVGSFSSLLLSLLVFSTVS